ncbi:integrase, catalytic region, zinc finger, CCHC-type containing protein [Tanacetum coccineum]
MIPKPGDPDRKVPVVETFHEQTDDELTNKEQMMKGFDIGAQEKKAKFFNERQRFTSTDWESIESYYHHFSKLMNDFKRNKHFPEKIASNLKFLNNLQPEWKRHIIIVRQTKDLHEVDYTQLYDFLKMNQEEMSLVLMAKAFKFNHSTPINNNQRVLYNPCNKKIVQPGMNIGQDRQMQIDREWECNVVAARAEGNGNGNNGNQVRCYNCRGIGHLARNCTVRPRRRDAAYLQTQLLIAEKEEARI